MEAVTFDPKEFAEPEDAKLYPDEFGAYAELRVIGIASDLALMEAFDMVRFGLDLSNVKQLALACEVNPFVRLRRGEILEAKSIKADL